MKKKTNLFARAAMTLLLAVLCSVGVWAQSEVVTVGTGGRASSYLPCYPNNTYSMSQQIYTSEEIGKAGLITSIAFYNYDTGSARECDIYLSYTAKTSFDSSTDWVTVSAENLVFSGTMKLGSEWTIIDFDTPFQYDGTQNLLLTVDDNTGKDTGSNFSISVSEVSSNQALYYYKMFGTPVNLDPTQAITEEGTVYDRKNYIKLCFETYPKPYRFEAVEVGDVSAQVQCSLRGDATAWNLRYRKVAGEGEEEQRWITPEAITDRSYTIEDLTPHTKYEAQVQGVFADDHFSDWTEPLVFTTNCCPVEQQAEIIYALNSNYSNYYGYAVQFIDITDAENPVEVAYVNPPGYGLYGGSLTLCCGHKYKVNWISDAEHPDSYQNYSLALYFEPGDLFYTMARGGAPSETGELTTFVMDCGDYCAQMPGDFEVAGTTFNSATLHFIAETKNGEVVYSTEADFDPNMVTPTSVTFDELTVDPDSWIQNPPNRALTLTGLEPLTTYYVSMRAVCETGGTSRWSNPVKVTTGSRYDAPSQVIAKAINSRTEDLSWSGNGNERAYNLYYRLQAAGNPVNLDDVITFGGGNGEGFDNGSWGKGIMSSHGNRPFSNTLFVSNVPAGSSFSFKAGNGKSGGGAISFLYGMQKQQDGAPLDQMKHFDKKCLNDADRAAVIKGLENKLKETTDEELITSLKAEIDELNSLPTDAQKLARMKELEKFIENIMAELASLAFKNANGEISDIEYLEQRLPLEAQKTLAEQELSELRAITTDAENPNNDGFSISNAGNASAQSPHRAPENETYIFFIRHADPNGILLVKDLTITPPEKLGEWIVIPNITGTQYTLTGLAPGTTYETMVEPIYEDGTTGMQSPITVFTTLGAETEPTESMFSVSDSKKVLFAKGNLRCEGDRYEAAWSMAKQQYEVLGQDNINVQGERSYPAWLIDLLCWSTAKNYYGIDNMYYYDDDEAQSYFNGEFADWGECPTLVRDLGTGWTTLSKDEWNYLLNERKDAAQLKSLATVNGVKGLVLLPDEWTAPDGVLISDEMTAEQWAAIEQTGAVFLPAAGQMTSTYVDYVSTTTVNDAATYWTSTPADDASGMSAIVLTIGQSGATLDATLSRRVMTAVRLVKDSGYKPDTPTILDTPIERPADNNWYTLDGRRLAVKPTQRGIYINSGRKVVIR